MSLGVGIIGYGFMGHKHAAMISGIEELCLVGVCDVRSERMEDAPEGVLRFTSAQQLLEIGEIQVVVIAVNSNLHRELILMTAAAGRDVICEMPLTLYVSDFDAVVRDVGRYRTRLAVSEYRRYDRDYMTAKQVYDSGTLGNLYIVKSYLYTFGGKMQDWRSQLSAGGGLLYDWGVHLLDQILDMIDGKILTVYANTRRVVNQEVEDYFDIFLKFDNGIFAEIEVGTHYLSDKENWFGRHWYLSGDQGAAYIDGFSAQGRIVRLVSRDGSGPDEGTPDSGNERKGSGGPVGIDEIDPENRLMTESLPVAEGNRQKFYENYLRARKGEEEYAVTIPEARRTLRLINAVRESSSSGRTIEFEG